jgi:hypothetical protein
MMVIMQLSQSLTSSYTFKRFNMKTEQWQWSANTGWIPGLLPETADLGTSAQLVFLFGSVLDIEAGRCFDLVRRIYPNAHLFGCTTGGEIHGRYITDHTVTITAIAFEDSHVALARAGIPDIDHSFEAGVNLMQSLDPTRLQHVFVLSEGLLVNASELILGINSVLPAGVNVSGGFAADGNRWMETHVWCDGDPERSSVVALAFYGDRLRIGVSTGTGWDPFGPDRLITKSKGNVLYEIDGHPALNLYRQYLGQYARSLEASGFFFPQSPDLLDSGLMFPLAVRLGDNQERVIRAIIGMNEEERSITFAGNVPEGSYARMMRGRIEHLIDGARAAGIASTRNPASFTPQFSLLVGCTGRRYVLKQRTEEEVEAINAVLGDQTVVTGFYAMGEIGPVRVGGRPELHNETMIVTTFAEV